MLAVETVARIRREFFIRGKSIKEIVRELGVSRSGATAFSYERTVQPLPKLGPWARDLERLLEANKRKARRERLTMVRIYEELQGLGYRVSPNRTPQSGRCCDGCLQSGRLGPPAGEPGRLCDAPRWQMDVGRADREQL